MTDASQDYAVIARRMLLYASPGEHTASACAISAVSLLERFQRRLAPLIGAEGMRALFTRAIKVTNADFAALARLRVATLDETTNVNLPEALVDALNGMDSATAWAAAEVLYTNFLELTASLIGERLVSLVLKRAFPKIDVFAKQESE